MHHDASRVLRAHVFPILLGDGPEARQLSFRLWLATGVRSTVCHTSRTRLTILCPFCRYFETPSPLEPDLLAEALCHLVADTELLGVLIPCDGESERFLAEKEEALAPYFLIRSRKDALATPPLSEL